MSDHNFSCTCDVYVYVFTCEGITRVGGFFGRRGVGGFQKKCARCVPDVCPLAVPTNFLNFSHGFFDFWSCVPTN